MCVTIFINRGEKQIESPRQFLEHFGFEAPKNEHYQSVDMNNCLCQVDVGSALTEHNIEFEIDDLGDFYISEVS